VGLDNNLQKVIFSWDKTSLTMSTLESKLTNSGSVYQPIEINHVRKKILKNFQISRKIKMKRMKKWKNFANIASQGLILNFNVGLNIHI